MSKSNWKALDFEMLQPATAEIFRAFPVRKNKAQKAAFRAQASALLQAAGWPVQVEDQGNLPRSHNLVAGNVDDAELVLTAHYDTPARMPLPNFIMPRNLLFTLLLQLPLMILFLFLFFAATFAAFWLGLPPLVAILTPLLLAFALLALLLVGPANLRNANDNTSGVVTLLEIAQALPPTQRQKVALVFFDCEEHGLVGSSRFRAKYGNLPGKLLLNFDCVGDGDTLLFVQPRACCKQPAIGQALQAAFGAAAANISTARAQAGSPAGSGNVTASPAAPPAKTVRIDRSALTLYPSDQLHFAKGIGVCALHKSPLGLWVGRIHTGRDVVLDTWNIRLLRDGVLAFMHDGQS